MTDNYDTVHVHVDNHEDFKITRTEEHEPEHFECRTYTVNGTITAQVQQNAQKYVRILELNPLRKEAAILSLDATVVICHSEAQANSVANQIAGLPDPDGVPLGVNQNLSVSGSGPLWAVATVAGVARIAVIANVRGKG